MTNDILSKNVALYSKRKTVVLNIYRMRRVNKANLPCKQVTAFNCILLRINKNKGITVVHKEKTKNSSCAVLFFSVLEGLSAGNLRSWED